MTAATVSPEVSSTPAPTHLHRSHKNARTLVDSVLTLLAFTASAIALLPLFSVLYMLRARGDGRLSVLL